MRYFKSNGPSEISSSFRPIYIYVIVCKYEYVPLISVKTLLQIEELRGLSPVKIRNLLLLVLRRGVFSSFIDSVKVAADYSTANSSKPAPADSYNKRRLIEERKKALKIWH